MVARTVLILTHSADEYVIERVSAALERRKLAPLRFDTDLFPARTRLSARIGARAGARESAGARASRPRESTATRAGRTRESTGTHELVDGGVRLDFSTVHSVWARKIWMPALAADLEPRMVEGCVRESSAALYGILDGLAGVRWINALQANNAAENKLLQLRLAREVGLRVPETLVTNDPERARAFHAEHAPLVAKMLTPLSVSMGRASAFVHTSAVRDEDLEHLSGLRHSPIVFQERIEKDVELRVACVGARLFAGAIDASRTERGAVDWRLSRPDEVRWTRGSLPREVERQLIELMQRLDLCYGAIDLIRTPQGEHVFLEVNPGGEWGMLERDLELPISEALADELARE